MKFSIIVLILLSLSALVQADSIFVGTLERPDATITQVSGDSLIFQISGRQSTLPIAKITKLKVDSDPPLTAAEEEYANSQWDQAVDNYQKAIRTTAKQWVKDWAAMRLIDAANKSGRFDAAASAYIVSLLKNPAAPGPKPAMPDSKSTFLDTAVAEVNTNLGDSRLNNDQKRALLGFLIELQQARKDDAAEEAAYEQLAKLPGADANDPIARRFVAKKHLADASKYFTNGNFQQAANEIEANKAIFVDPSQQADALYILAEARYAMVGGAADDLKDAALNYMRVVALAKDSPGRPHVVDSLLKTADIMVKLNEPKSALQICQQIVAQYPDDPNIVKVKDTLNRLKQQATSN